MSGMAHDVLALAPLLARKVAEAQVAIGRTSVAGQPLDNAARGGIMGRTGHERNIHQLSP
jgi:hypothetical protein